MDRDPSAQKIEDRSSEQGQESSSEERDPPVDNSGGSLLEDHQWNLKEKEFSCGRFHEHWD